MANCRQNTSPYKNVKSFSCHDTRKDDVQVHNIDLNESERSAIFTFSSTPKSSPRNFKNDSADSDSFLSIGSNSQQNINSSSSFVSCKSSPTASGSSFGGDSLNSEKSKASSYNWKVFEPSSFVFEYSKDINCLEAWNSSPSGTSDTVKNMVYKPLDCEERESPRNPNIQPNYASEMAGINDSSVGTRGGLEHLRYNQMQFCNIRGYTATQICNSDGVNANECIPSVKITEDLNCYRSIGTQVTYSDLHLNVIQAEPKGMETRNLRATAGAQSRNLINEDLRTSYMKTMKTRDHCSSVGAQTNYLDIINASTETENPFDSISFRSLLSSENLAGNLEITEQAIGSSNISILHGTSTNMNRRMMHSNAERGKNHGMSDTTKEKVVFSKSFCISYLKRNVELLEQIKYIDSLVVRRLNYYEDFPPLN